MKKTSKVVGIILGLGSFYVATQVTFAQTLASTPTVAPDFQAVTGEMLQAAGRLEKTSAPTATDFAKVLTDVKEYQAYVATTTREKTRPTITGPATVTVGFGKELSVADFKAVAQSGQKLDVTPLTKLDNKKLGTQEIILASTDAATSTSRYKIINVNVADQTAPTLSVKNASLSTTTATEIDVLAGVTATDLETGDLTAKISHSAVDFSKAGTQTITYTVTDSANHTTTTTAKMTITAPKVTKTVQTPATANNTNTTVAATTTAAATSSYQANHIYFNGNSIPFANGGTGSGQQIIDSNPYGTASTYYGSDFSGTDGNFTHFIGHSGGVFAPVLGLGVGSAVTVTDSNGTPFTYHVYQTFNLTMTAGSDGMAYPNYSRWSKFNRRPLLRSSRRRNHRPPNLRYRKR